MDTIGQLNLFMVNAVNPPLRDNRDAMEFPFLSLQKKRTQPIEYRDKAISISVAADSRYSIATIWDWDLVIFAASHINDAIEAGHRPGPRIRFVPYDALRQMGRNTGGRDYRELVEAIRRLRMTTVVTNIRMDDDAGMERPFSWLSDYAIPKRYRKGAWMTPADDGGEPDPARPWEIELPAWLYNAILRRREILAVHPDYFRLTGGLERWLYRLARKAVPDKAEIPAFTFRMDTLHKRSGTMRPLKKFAFDIRQIAGRQELPEYGVKIVKDGRIEKVVLYRDSGKAKRPVQGRRLRMIENAADA